MVSEFEKRESVALSMVETLTKEKEAAVDESREQKERLEMVEEEKQTFANSVLSEWKEIEEERVKIMAQLEHQRNNQDAASEADITQCGATADIAVSAREEQHDESEQRVHEFEKVNQSLRAKKANAKTELNDLHNRQLIGGSHQQHHRQQQQQRQPGNQTEEEQNHKAHHGATGTRSYMTKLEARNKQSEDEILTLNSALVS